MKALRIAVLLMLLAVVGMAAAQWLDHTRSQPMRQGGFTSSTSTRPTPSGMNNLTSTQSSTASAAGEIAWATLTDGHGLYSIQYPTNYGMSYVTTSTTAGTTDLVTNLILEGTAPDWNSLDVWITPNDPTLESYLRTLTLIPLGSISKPGLTGTIYKESDDGAIVVFLFGTGPSSTSTFYLNFNHAEMGLSPNDVPLPTYWQQMLDSFQILTPS